MKSILLLFMGLFVLGTGRIAPTESILPQHPQIHDARIAIDGDDIVLTLDVVDDGAGWTTAGGATPATCAAAHSVELRTPYPPGDFSVTIHDQGGEPCLILSQLATFVSYVHGAMACDPDADLEMYNHVFSHNPRSPMSIVDLAGDLTQLRSQGPFNCDLGPIPPEAPNTCWTRAAPDVRRAALVGDTFWVDLVLRDDSHLFVSFMQKDGRWAMAGQQGHAGVCQGQLNHFVSYTSSTLNSPACQPPVESYPPEQADLLAPYTAQLIAMCAGEK